MSLQEFGLVFGGIVIYSVIASSVLYSGLSYGADKLTNYLDNRRINRDINQQGCQTAFDSDENDDAYLFHSSHFSGEIDSPRPYKSF